MGSLRSWLGSLLTLVVFFLARRYATGIAAPSFVAIFFACMYMWVLVLRVPELKGIEPAEEEQPRPSATSSNAATSMAATALPAPSMAAPAAPSTTSALPSTHEVAAPQVSAPTQVEATEAEVAEPKAAPDSAATPSSSAPPVPHEPLLPVAAAEEDVQSAGAGTAAEAAASTLLSEGGSAALGSAPAVSTVDDSDGSDADEEALKRQEQELEDEHADPEKAKELKSQGNDFFKANKLHDAREAYSEALYLTPSAKTEEEKREKAVLFSNRAACLQKLSRWEDVVEDCRKAIELDPTYAKAYHRRSAAHEALSKWHDANEDLKKVIELDPTMRAKEYKHQAVLEARSQEQFEKDKDEMMGKLKDLGNMVLGKFGMSVDNFKCEKDPSSGSYSIKFQQ